MIHCYGVADKQKKVKCIDDFLILTLVPLRIFRLQRKILQVFWLPRPSLGSSTPSVVPLSAENLYMIICTTCARVVCLCFCEQIDAPVSQVSWLGRHRARAPEDNESPPSSNTTPFVDRSVNNLQYSPTKAFRQSPTHYGIYFWPGPHLIRHRIYVLGCHQFHSVGRQLDSSNHNACWYREELLTECYFVYSSVRSGTEVLYCDDSLDCVSDILLDAVPTLIL
ncbi:hypothetical protein TNIN_334631 [Trichonephila inaurata madagascariensis]|uniref:Uncharacterized protein n=1 Tax=Trichonephila inaurata madagascariensis TaxID=2747483 RepID=A0A8X6YDF5_9ARAC|nr:hypothetical protein TNIN_334631 [Trichonephila inaurata madagascariensis]